MTSSWSLFIQLSCRMSKQNSVQSNKCFYSVQQTRGGGPGHSTHSLVSPSCFYASCTNRPLRLAIRTASQLRRNGIRRHQIPVLRTFALTSVTNFHHLIIYSLSFLVLTHSAWFIAFLWGYNFYLRLFYLRPLFFRNTTRA